jgi:hypothetical protein
MRHQNPSIHPPWSVYLVRWVFVRALFVDCSRYTKNLDQCWFCDDLILQWDGRGQIYIGEQQDRVWTWYVHGFPVDWLGCMKGAYPPPIRSTCTMSFAISSRYFTLNCLQSMLSPTKYNLHVLFLTLCIVILLRWKLFRLQAGTRQTSVSC